MSFRFRRRIKLFPGCWLNLSKSGVSASAGVPGLTINSRGTATAGLPGTGISYRQNLSTNQRRQAQRPAQTSTEQLIDEVLGAICGPSNVGDALWRQGLAELVLQSEEAPRNVREAALGVKSPEMVELRLRRARGPAATRSEALKITQDIQIVLAFTHEQGWSRPARGESN